jgi:hypothetical protein
MTCSTWSAGYKYASVLNNQNIQTKKTVLDMQNTKDTSSIEELHKIRKEMEQKEAQRFRQQLNTCIGAMHYRYNKLKSEDFKKLENGHTVIIDMQEDDPKECGEIFAQEIQEKKKGIKAQYSPIISAYDQYYPQCVYIHKE